MTENEAALRARITELETALKACTGELGRTYSQVNALEERILFLHDIVLKLHSDDA